MKFVFTTTASCAKLPKLPERTLDPKSLWLKESFGRRTQQVFESVFLFFPLFFRENRRGRRRRRKRVAEKPINQMTRLCIVEKTAEFPFVLLFAGEKGFWTRTFHIHRYFQASDCQDLNQFLSCRWARIMRMREMTAIGCASIGAGLYGSRNWPPFSISITMRWCLREKMVTTLLLCSNGQNLVCPMLMSPLFFSRRPSAYFKAPKLVPSKVVSGSVLLTTFYFECILCLFCAKITCLKMSDFSSFGKKNTWRAKNWVSMRVAEFGVLGKCTYE